MKNRIVVIEKSTNKNITFVLFLPSSIYLKKMSDIIGTVTRKNSKNMTDRIGACYHQVFLGAVLSAKMNFVTFIRNETKIGISLRI